MRVVLSVLTVIAVGVLASSGIAAPADITTQIQAQLRTSIFHASELAQRGSAIAGTRTHLQHVVNCIEGTAGKDFVAAPGYPCQGQGNGIIPDLQAARAQGVRGAERALLFVNAALSIALRGIASTDVNESQPFATVVARQLQEAANALGR